MPNTFLICKCEWVVRCAGISCVINAKNTQISGELSWVWVVEMRWEKGKRVEMSACFIWKVRQKYTLSIKWISLATNHFCLGLESECGRESELHLVAQFLQCKYRELSLWHLICYFVEETVYGFEHVLMCLTLWQYAYVGAHFFNRYLGYARKVIYIKF